MKKLQQEVNDGVTLRRFVNDWWQDHTNTVLGITAILLDIMIKCVLLYWS